MRTRSLKERLWRLAGGRSRNLLKLDMLTSVLVPLHLARADPVQLSLLSSRVAGSQIVLSEFLVNIHGDVSLACEEEGRMESICKAAIKLGANDAKLIRAEDVVTGHWVRLKCMYGCDDYGRNLACPPHSPTPNETREILKEYTWALLIKMTPPDLGSYSVYTHELIFKIEREAFLMGYYKAFGFASGHCPYCEECNLKTCAHPEKRRPSMEACGIDVFETARKAGYNMGVYKERDAKPSFFGLLLVV